MLQKNEEAGHGLTPVLLHNTASCGQNDIHTTHLISPSPQTLSPSRPIR